MHIQNSIKDYLLDMIKYSYNYKVFLHLACINIILNRTEIK